MNHPQLSNDSIHSSLADDEMMCELVEEFVGEIPNRMKSLQDAMAAGDLDAVQRLAHQLKGAFGSYGFSGMTEPARQLEQRATHERETLDLIRQDVESLVAYCTRMTAAPATGN